MNQDEVIFEVSGTLGLITLNRPKALNALTHNMCVKLYEQLQIWKLDSNIGAVLIKGAGGRAFCAGGDVVEIYNSGKANKQGDKTATAWRDFFRDEYRLNAAIHDFPKPYIALMDGFTMGGGVGVSVHGSHRVASEGTKLSMPETGLGLIPDVGGGYFLPRLVGEMGMYLALTGARVKAADCMALGICNSYVPSEYHQQLIAALGAQDMLSDIAVDRIISSFSQTPQPSELIEKQADIDSCFSKASVDEIIAALHLNGSVWAKGVVETIDKMSPTSLKITFRQMRLGAELDIHDDLKMEFRVVNRIILADDFYEGVRSIILDKDFAPKWQPNKLNLVDDNEVEGYFADLGDDELQF
jgi:enoyl-CoA hydratase/carnithine racemase